MTTNIIIKLENSTILENVSPESDYMFMKMSVNPSDILDENKDMLNVFYNDKIYLIPISLNSSLKSLETLDLSKKYDFTLEVYDISNVMKCKILKIEMFSEDNDEDYLTAEPDDDDIQNIQDDLSKSIKYAISEYETKLSELKIINDKLNKRKLTTKELNEIYNEINKCFR